MADPTFGAWTWFYTTDVGAADYLRVYLNASGSGTWVLAYEHRGTRNHWTEIAIPVNQFLPAATSFRVRFTASDSAAGTVTEAAIDDAVVYERALPVTHVAESPRLMLRAPWPNPGSGAVRLTVAAKRWAPDFAKPAIVDGHLAHPLPGSASRILIAAGRLDEAQDGPMPQEVFNGKIARPRIGRGAAHVRAVVREVVDGDEKDVHRLRR